MTYAETIQWLFQQLPMFQREGKVAYKADLSNINLLVKHLNNPQNNFKSVHIAGTNGKGSTCSMIAAILQTASYKVGLFTSPHLKDYRERIKINGKPIEKDFVVDFMRKNKSFFQVNSLSFFEMTTGLAFEYFSEQNVDIAIIETGMGGRLDSTNIIYPLVTAITNIGIDHTAFLGNTLQEIAYEKAGIIKKNIPIVIGEYTSETKSVFTKIAVEKTTPLFFAQHTTCNYTTDLLGKYQEKNITTAVMVIKILTSFFTITDAHIQTGLNNVVALTGLLGRWQIVQKQPLVICDTAHNKQGLTTVLKQIKNTPHRALHIVLGMVNDKNLDDILPLFPKNATYYFCKPNVPRGLSTTVLHKKAGVFSLKGNVHNSVSEAYKNALKNADKNDMIYVGGSTFVVAEVI